MVADGDAIERVGLVGLGNLGLPMARRLLACGWPLTVHDVRDEAVQEALQAGARQAEDVKSLVDASDLVGVVVWDDTQLLDLLLGSRGLLRAARPEQLVLVHSSASPATIQRLGNEFSAKGVHLLDAPVSGGAAGRVGMGELTVMVGGDREDVSRAMPVLDALARHVHHVGPLGSGTVAKIANNTMSIGNMLFVMEAVRFAQAHDVDVERVLQIAADSSGQSYAAENIRGALAIMDTHAAGAEAPGKDLFLTVLAAREHHLHLPLTALAASLSQEILRAGATVFRADTVSPRGS